MKTTMKTFAAAAIAAAVIPVIPVNAQYQPTGADGISASPKVRQMLNEQKKSAPMACCPAPTAASRTANPKDIAASPKVRQMLAEQKHVAAAPNHTAAMASAESVGYRATGADGTTASPRLREQLNARGSSFEIAPIK